MAFTLAVALLASSLGPRPAGGGAPRLTVQPRDQKLRQLRGGAAEPSGDNVDEGLYSRQLYVIGHKAQRSLASSTVLLLGLSGLGAEVAKNLVLAGVAGLDVHDETPASLADLSSSFLLREEDVGAPRAARAPERLAPLNPHVAVAAAAAGPFDAERLRKYACVVAVDRPLDEQLALDAACRAAGCRLVCARSAGLFGSVFCDFGDAFEVDDADGEPPRQALLEHVGAADDGTVVTVPEQPHGLQDGDVVRFEDVDGMEALCEAGRAFAVRVVDRHTLRIGDTRGLGEYARGGRLIQVKQPSTLAFAPLAAVAADPAAHIVDVGGASARRALTTHACFCALDARGAAGPPAAGCADSAAAFLDAVRGGGVAPADAIDEAAVLAFARGAAGALSPLAAFFGGVAAQEALKACTGRFTPLRQLLCADFADALPAPPPDADACAPRGDRLDGQRAVLGDPLCARLAGQRAFVVGAGAIGCELLKCLALMGVGTGDGGEVVVTDMDTIERSNLNRQFLFRPDDVGKAKSACAAAACKGINPGFRVTSHEERVGGDGGPFDEAFWRGLDIVCNALDNVEARLYVDRQCVRYGLPLLESGTSGTKGNVQVVVPYLSESYGSTTDPPEEATPVCTLKSFPYRIEHTLQWARDLFEGEFAQAPAAVNAWLERDDYFGDLQRDDASAVAAAVAAVHEATVGRAADAASCVRWALGRFASHFDTKIRALVRQYPPDHATDGGAPFWSGTRRCPTPTPFDAANADHRAFALAAARLRARTLGLGDAAAALTDDDLDALLAAAASGGGGGEDDEEEEEEERVPANEAEAAALAKAGPSAAAHARLRRQLDAGGAVARDAAAFRASPEDFEKDDDTNSHIDFVAAASNLRAANYGIPTVDRHAAKQIAGRIVPAIATTTAAVVGLVGVEAIKLAASAEEGEGEGDELDRYRNAFLNLALPLFAFAQPSPAEEYAPPAGGAPWTLWSVEEVAEGRALTLKELVALLEARWEMEVSVLEGGGCVLYSSIAPPAGQKGWMETAVREVVAEASGGGGADGGAVLLRASCYDEELDEDVDAPRVIYRD